MNTSIGLQSHEELLEENRLLREELQTARKASDVKNKLVVNQFQKIDGMLKRLEEEAAKEQNLRRRLEEELRISDERKRDLEQARALAEQSLKELQKTQKHLVESEKMAALGELVAGIAHEINTPMGVSITAATHLQEKLKDLEREYLSGDMKRSTLEGYLSVSGETLEITMTNLMRAAELISSFKQVAVDQSSEDRRKFDFKAYLNEILLSLKHEYKRTGHRIIISGTDNLLIDSYPGSISQIVTNLLMNSLIHAYAPDVEGNICLDVRRDNDNMVFMYSDDGNGIGPENLKHIFEPFFTTRRGQGGSGLGMHIVYNLVTTRLNGTIKCTSKPGKGTTFIVTFPVNAGDDI